MTTHYIIVHQCRTEVLNCITFTKSLHKEIIWNIVLFFSLLNPFILIHEDISSIAANWQGYTEFLNMIFTSTIHINAEHRTQLFWIRACAWIWGVWVRTRIWPWCISRSLTLCRGTSISRRTIDNRTIDHRRTTSTPTTWPCWSARGCWLCWSVNKYAISFISHENIYVFIWWAI